MNLKPNRGILFVVPIDEIKPVKVKAGFEGKAAEKQKPETPYKFKVVAVGGPLRVHDIWIPCDAQVGDIISHTSTNAHLREQIEESGMLLDGVQHLVLDFNDVLGVWKEETCPLVGCQMIGKHEHKIEGPVQNTTKNLLT
jgi:hypothetical protein